MLKQQTPNSSKRKLFENTSIRLRDRIARIGLLMGASPLGATVPMPRSGTRASCQTAERVPSCADTA